MYLYNLTLQKGTGVTHAVHGNFSGGKQQEVLLSRGKSLELLRPDPNTGKVHTLMSTEIFGCIRALMAFRLTGGTKGWFSLYICTISYIFIYAQNPIEATLCVVDPSLTLFNVSKC